MATEATLALQGGCRFVPPSGQRPWRGALACLFHSEPAGLSLPNLEDLAYTMVYKSCMPRRGPFRWPFWRQFSLCEGTSPLLLSLPPSL